MPNYVSVRIEPCRTAKACLQAEHDTRTRPPSYLKTDANAETYLWKFDKKISITGEAGKIRERTPENDENRRIVRDIIKRSAKEQQERYLTSVKRTPQANANWFIRGIITFSPEGVPSAEATGEEREKFDVELVKHAKNYIETVAARLSVNPVYMSLHCDESTVHVHYLLENSDKDTGRSVSRKIKPSDCRKLQDMAGVAFAEMGFQRGVSRDVTGARHQTVRESHRIEQQKLEGVTAKKVEQLEEVSDEVGGLELRREALEVDTKEEKRRAKQAEKQRKDEEKKKAEAERITTEAVLRAREAQQEAERFRWERINEQVRLNQVKAKCVQMVQEAERMANYIKLGEWAKAEAELLDIDRTAPGFAEFERFVRMTGCKVFQLQEQECSSRGGAQRWQKWHAPEIVTAGQLLSRYKDMQGANRAEWNPSDWHLRTVGTPPIWVLDDVSAEQISEMCRDGIAPFIIVETSQGNYQTWIRLQSDKDFLKPDDWHLIHRHLRDRYDADKGAGGAEHAYRLPLPASFSHKRAESFQMRVSVNDTSGKSVEDVLADIPQWKKNRNHVPVANFSSVPELWAVEEVDIPNWFREKWERRRSELIASAKCPQKNDGTPDWSSVDFTIAKRFLYGYRDRKENQQAKVALWLTKILADEAAKREKPKPIQYAQRTVFNVASQLNLDIVRQHDDRGNGNPLLEHAMEITGMSR